jgi:hypothetical protein
MAFIKDTIFKPISIVWVLLTGGASIAAIFLDLQSIDATLKTLGVISISSSVGLLTVLYQSYGHYQRSRDPALIKIIIEGTHLYQGNLMIIFDKSPWISIGQVLVLVQESEDVQIPIALVSIETTTTKGFPQGVIFQPLSSEDIRKYLADSSRWKSIIGLPDIKQKYIIGVENA